MVQHSRLEWNRLHWFIDHTGHRYEGTPRQGRSLAHRAIETGGNNYLILLVTALGFFTDSYVLFASNAITPMLGYVYWNRSTTSSHDVRINIATLSGCIAGMLLFGWLADRYGRRKMYGYELIILMVGTFGLIMSSTGFTPPYNAPSDGSQPDVDWGSYGSMNIYSWLVFWRFVTGVGIGADYPLSAVIVSEFSPTRRRGMMLAAVFAMQAFGYAAASIVSLVVTVIVRSHHPVASARAVDQIWRWVMGLGLIPATLAVILRLTIPESPRYTLDVADDLAKAFDESNRFNNAGLEDEWNRNLQIQMIEDYTTLANGTESIKQDLNIQVHPKMDPSLTVKEYFGKRKYWKILAGTALSWFALDIGFYALSLNSPQQISKIWYFAPASSATRVWDTDPDVDNPQTSIYTILIANSTHSLAISSIGAILGSLAMVYAINRFNRKHFQLITFLVLGVLFIITGATFTSTVNTPYHGITMALYCLCELCFYFGPNTLTFIFPAELFPTKYRATCHGISAASGKIGSVIITAFVAFVKFGHVSSGTFVPEQQSKWLGWVLLICAFPMFVGALVTYYWIPNIQTKNNKNLSLEELVWIKDMDIEHTDD